MHIITPHGISQDKGDLSPVMRMRFRGKKAEIAGSMLLRRFDGSLLMKTTLNVLQVCICFALVGWGVASADPIDDLLSGKAVLVEEESASEEAVFAPLSDDAATAEEPQQAEAVTPVPGPQASEPSAEEQLATDPSWSVGLHGPEKFDLDLEPKQVVRRGSSLPTPFTVVPEPSAIALAAASLVYFLIFFRRRYSL